MRLVLLYQRHFFANATELVIDEFDLFGLVHLVPELSVLNLFKFVSELELIENLPAEYHNIVNSRLLW